MNILRITSVFFLPLVLIACAAKGPDANPHAPQSGPMTTGSATLRVGNLDSGFLFLGNTRISVVSVDGERRGGDDQGPVLLAPGTHTILVRSFRDPVLAYACVTAPFEAGKANVAQSTKPFIEKTTLWIEDATTGEVIGQKVDARTMRQPILWSPALNSLVNGAPPDKC